MSTTPAPALPGLAPARQPYPGGAERHVPIVPHALIIGERKGSYLPPPITRAATVYDTPTTVRVRLPTGRQETQAQHKVWAVPDDAAWLEIEAAVACFSQRLAELADVLRRLGRYKDRLTAAGGLKGAPNPLCPSVARIDDPDVKGTNWWLSAWHVPRLDRTPVERHTPKMLSSGGTGSYVFNQDNCFVLADDADWAAVEAAHQAAEAAAREAEALLARLGTYQDALDGRHASRVSAPPPATQPVRAPHPASVAGSIAPIREQRPSDAEQAELKRLVRAAGGTWYGLSKVDGEDSRYQLAFHGERQDHYTAAQIRARLTPPPAEAKALIVAERAIDGIVVMTREEARAAADAIKVAVEDLRVKIDAFDQGRGWQALGYESFRAWAAAEIPDTSIRHVYRLRDAAEVDRSLGLPVGATPESHARELKDVPPAARADVLGQADARAQQAGRARTAADVRAVAQAQLPADWDAARERARAIGARLWHNESDGTYTLSERAGHVPRTSSWSELLMWLRQAEQRAQGAAAPVAGADDPPLTEAELAELSRLGGWELDLSRAPKPGKVVLRLCRGEHWDTTEERSPDGWRFELQQLRAAEAGQGVTNGHTVGAAAAAGGSLTPDEAHARRIYIHTPRELIPADWDVWQERARAIGAELTLGVGGIATGVHAGRRMGSYALPGRWAELTGEIEALARAAALAPAFDYPAWSRRAAAVGANLKAYARDYELVAADGTRQRYADDQAAALTAHIERLERAAAAAPPPPSAAVPLDDEAPDADAYSYGETAEGDPVVMVLRDGLHPATADAIAAAAVALRCLALGAAIDTAALDDLVARLDEAPEAGRETLKAVLAEIANDADILAEKGVPS